MNEKADLIATSVVLSVIITSAIWFIPYKKLEREAITPQKIAAALSNMGDLIDTNALTNIQETPVSTNNPIKHLLTANELKTEVERQPVRLIEARLTPDDDLSIVVTNETKSDIKDVYISCVGWDKNDLPLQTTEFTILNEDDFIMRGRIQGANIIPNGSRDALFKNVFRGEPWYVNAIIRSYTTYDGEKWNNPLYADWMLLLEGKKRI